MTIGNAIVCTQKESDNKTIYTQNCSFLNTLRTGDADLRFYITTVQDG